VTTPAEGTTHASVPAVGLRANAAGGAAAAGVVIASGLAFHRAFDLDALLPVVVTPVAVVAAVTAVRLRFAPGASAVRSVASSAVAWLVCATLLFRTHLPQSLWSDGAAALHATVTAWTQLLGTTLWAQPAPDLLLVPQLLTWMAATATAETLTRTRSVMLPLLPPLATFVVALLYTVPGPGTNVPTAVAVVLLPSRNVTTGLYGTCGIIAS